MTPGDDAIFEFPCDFPIKVMGRVNPDFAPTVIEVVKQFDPEFTAARLETRPSSGGNYVGLTCTVNAVSRAQLDDIYRALSGHPMVSVVL